MRKERNWMKTTALLGLVLVIAFSMSGLAVAGGLPKTFAWTAYGVKSSGYAVSVAVGNTFSKYGYKLRVLPAKNDISRMTPLKTGKVPFSAMGVGAYLAQEGVLDFGTPNWGPQPARLMIMCWGDFNTGLPGTAKDANIMKASDMKGKRIAWVVGAPALNQNMTSFLAFGDLTWDDVVKVRVPGWSASLQGIIDGNIDAAIGSTNSSMFHQVAGSPRGLRWFPVPHNDKEGWKRMTAQAPWRAPHFATAGVGLSKDNPLEGSSYGYPIMITYANQDDQAVYELIELFHTKFDEYKGSHNSCPGWEIKKQVFDWVIPYHPGAVKYFKEIGVWNDKFQKNNDDLIKRQGVLMEAWKKAVALKKKGDDHLKAWMKIRKEALVAAGMDPIW